LRKLQQVTGGLCERKPKLESKENLFKASLFPVTQAMFSVAIEHSFSAALGLAECISRLTVLLPVQLRVHLLE
jgi:hypothetical protein